MTESKASIMAATLANAGVNPTTGEQVVPRSVVAPVLTVMSTCGMYDYAGEWLCRVGLPAKSGVSGAVAASLPGQLGLAAHSPRLDARGNTVRGVAACEALLPHPLPRGVRRTAAEFTKGGITVYPCGSAGLSERLRASTFEIATLEGS